MSSAPTNFLCDEAAWIYREMQAFARDAALPDETETQLLALTARLANAVFVQNAVCLPIADADEIAFLSALAKQNTPLLASDADARTPLVFEEKIHPERPTLYFRKQFAEEVFIAQSIRRNTACAEEAIPDSLEKIITAGTAEGFAFPLAAEQQEAVRKLLRQRFTIISGGPGTGKTSLLLRALICLLSKQADARIAIAAPTGKAAARVRESVAGQINALDTSKALPFDRSIPEKISNIVPRTLHRLLGLSVYSPNPKAFSADVVIIDEASMISQSLMAALLRACPPNAKLILLGDKNQLDSVQPGHVFGDFYNAGSLAPSRAALEQSHRFSRDRFIGQFADAVLRGNSEAASVLLSGTLPKNHHVAACQSARRRNQIEEALRSTLPESLKNPPEDADPKALLLALENSRILTPIAEGAFGKNEINNIAQQLFAPHAHGEHFHGRPILITQNAPEQRLNNGDIGIILRARDRNGAKPPFFAWFLDENGTPRAFPTAFLPPHETAYAMTVHKSQGSEFSRLCLFFPAVARAGFYTRQLLYTAITRFKETPQSRFELVFDGAAVTEAIRTGSVSHSLLAKRL